MRQVLLTIVLGAVCTFAGHYTAFREGERELVEAEAVYQARVTEMGEEMADIFAEACENSTTVSINNRLYECAPIIGL